MADFGTKLWAAQDHLEAQLRARAELDPWTIEFGLPPRRDDRHIWIDDEVNEWDQDSVTTGEPSRDETFELSVWIWRRQTAASARELRDQIKGTADVIADLIGQDPTLGGTVLFAKIGKPRYDSAFADDQGKTREALLKLVVECSAFVA